MAPKVDSPAPPSAHTETPRPGVPAPKAGSFQPRGTSWPFSLSTLRSPSGAWRVTHNLLMLQQVLVLATGPAVTDAHLHLGRVLRQHLSRPGDIGGPGPVDQRDRVDAGARAVTQQIRRCLASKDPTARQRSDGECRAPGPRRQRCSLRDETAGEGKVRVPDVGECFGTWIKAPPRLSLPPPSPGRSRGSPLGGAAVTMDGCWG